MSEPRAAPRTPPAFSAFRLRIVARPSIKTLVRRLEGDSFPTSAGRDARRAEGGVVFAEDRIGWTGKGSKETRTGGILTAMSASRPLSCLVRVMLTPVCARELTGTMDRLTTRQRIPRCRTDPTQDLEDRVGRVTLNEPRTTAPRRLQGTTTAMAGTRWAGGVKRRGKGEGCRTREGLPTKEATREGSRLPTRQRQATRGHRHMTDGTLGTLRDRRATDRMVEHPHLRNGEEATTHGPTRSSRPANV